MLTQIQPDLLHSCLKSSNRRPCAVRPRAKSKSSVVNPPGGQPSSVRFPATRRVFTLRAAVSAVDSCRMVSMYLADTFWPQLAGCSLSEEKRSSVERGSPDRSLCFMSLSYLIERDFLYPEQTAGIVKRECTRTLRRRMQGHTQPVFFHFFHGQPIFSTWDGGQRRVRACPRPPQRQPAHFTGLISLSEAFACVLPPSPLKNELKCKRLKKNCRCCCCFVRRPGAWVLTAATATLWF